MHKLLEFWVLSVRARYCGGLAPCVSNIFFFCLQHFIRCLKEKAPYNASILTAITVRISFVCVVLILVITHINSDSNRYDGRGSLRPSYGKNSDASMLAHFNNFFLLEFCLD